MGFSFFITLTLPDWVPCCSDKSDFPALERDALPFTNPFPDNSKNANTVALSSRFSRTDERRRYVLMVF